METIFSTDLWQSLQTLAGPVGAAAWGVAVSDFFRNVAFGPKISKPVQLALFYMATAAGPVLAVAALQALTPEQIAVFAPYYKMVVVAVYAYVGGRVGFEVAKRRTAG